MSLSAIHQHEEDKTLKQAIRNAFALLTDADIFRVCEALANGSPSAATASIIEIVGPESGRVAALLPALWSPLTLADEPIAAKVVVAATAFKGRGAPTKEELKKAVDTFASTPEEARAAHIDIERTAASAIEWGFAGKLIADLAISFLTKRLPMLKFATRLPFGIRAAGLLGGATYGAAREASREGAPLPLPPKSE